MVHSIDILTSYLKHLSPLQGYFFDLSHLWIDTVTDMEMLEFSNKFEKYNPCVEDISLEDDILVDAVSRIESE